MHEHAARCMPRDVYTGDPMLHDPARREALEAYLGMKDRNLPQEMQRWRKLVGRPAAAGGAAAGAPSAQRLAQRAQNKAQRPQHPQAPPRGRAAAGH